MLLESTTFWLIVFYAFVGCAIAGLITVYRLVNRSRFRYDDGEGVGVGYEEDSVGHVLGKEPGPDIVGDEHAHPPHISVNPNPRQ